MNRRTEERLARLEAACRSVTAAQPIEVYHLPDLAILERYFAEAEMLDDAGRERLSAEMTPPDCLITCLTVWRAAEVLQAALGTEI